MDVEIKTEWLDAWRESQSLGITFTRHPQISLADLAVFLLAKLLNSEFQLKHRVDKRSGQWCLDCSWGDIHRVEPPDPRHNFTFADWQAEARKILGGENG